MKKENSYVNRLPTMTEITNWYLYKQKNIPTDKERLEAKIISNKNPKLYVNVNIWNTTVCKISDDAVFVVDKDGNWCGQY